MNLQPSRMTDAIPIYTRNLNCCDQERMQPMASNRVYVGTYTDPSAQAGYEVTPDRPVMGMTGPTGSAGIYVFSYEPESGAWTPLGTAGGFTNPSFLALDPGERFLFAVNETLEFQGEETGAVSSFALEPDSGLPRPLSQAPSGGSNPCHLALAPCQRHLLVADWGAGRVAVLPISERGILSRPTDIKQDETTDPGRPPHAHFVTPDPAGHFILTSDTTTDRIMVYRLDPVTGRLEPHDPPWAETHPGGSPRHLAFHPSGRYLFANGEADLTLSVFSYDAEHGVLTYLNRESTVPPGSTGRNSTAQLLAHPNGRFVYVSNRGPDTIAIFAFDESTGIVTRIANEPTLGETPRNFMIDPSGRFLFVTNQNSDTIVGFAIDPVTGILSEPREVARVPAPTCIVFTQT
jgi:6-phosphogluconolactonase